MSATGTRLLVAGNVGQLAMTLVMLSHRCSVLAVQSLERPGATRVLQNAPQHRERSFLVVGDTMVIADVRSANRSTSRRRKATMVADQGAGRREAERASNLTSRHHVMDVGALQVLGDASVNLSSSEDHQQAVRQDKEEKVRQPPQPTANPGVANASVSHAASMVGPHRSFSVALYRWRGWLLAASASLLVLLAMNSRSCYELLRAPGRGGSREHGVATLQTVVWCWGVAAAAHVAVVLPMCSFLASDLSLGPAATGALIGAAFLLEAVAFLPWRGGLPMSPPGTGRLQWGCAGHIIIALVSAAALHPWFRATASLTTRTGLLFSARLSIGLANLPILRFCNLYNSSTPGREQSCLAMTDSPKAIGIGVGCLLCAVCWDDRNAGGSASCAFAAAATLWLPVLALVKRLAPSEDHMLVRSLHAAAQGCASTACQSPDEAAALADDADAAAGAPAAVERTLAPTVRISLCQEICAIGLTLSAVRIAVLAMVPAATCYLLAEESGLQASEIGLVMSAVFVMSCLWRTAAVAVRKHMRGADGTGSAAFLVLLALVAICAVVLPFSQLPPFAGRMHRGGGDILLMRLLLGDLLLLSAFDGAGSVSEDLTLQHAVTHSRRATPESLRQVYGVLKAVASGVAPSMARFVASGTGGRHAYLALQLGQVIVALGLALVVRERLERLRRHDEQEQAAALGKSWPPLQT
eukprot:TRINITY_DN36435_c0_g1_i3.p1 TRINITY_DN36435_c0_g1~~TRINITY_DN36435_c0_g1_i3.p1  ORF type:complete len:698 (+),score=106.91 TRINITY_DN36435_c0_g1_i3:194-2287(+)